MTKSLREYAKERLAAVKAARIEQVIRTERYAGPNGRHDSGTNYRNFSRTISNRMLSLYDDCELLITEDRISSACVLARCVIETFAVGHFAQFEIEKALKTGGPDKAGRVILEYINSSRLKVEEQKRFKTMKFSASDYHFTEQALERMLKEEAAAKHIMNALRYLFRLEMNTTGRTESQLEFVYEALSEWTHPSQTSLMHAFTREAWDIPTSIGPVSLWDAALECCSDALCCLLDLPELTSQMHQLASQLSAKETAN